MEVAAALRRSRQLLHVWLNARRPVDPTVALLVHLKVTKLQEILLAGIYRHDLVSVDQWKHAVRELHCLTNWPAAIR